MGLPGAGSCRAAGGPLMDHSEMVTLAGRLAERYSVRWAYWPDSRKVQGCTGFPDIILCGSHRFMVREIKAGMDTLNPGQTAWRYSLISAGIDWGVWRLADFISGRAEQEMKNLNEQR